MQSNEESWKEERARPPQPGFLHQVWSCHIKSFLGGGRGPSSQILSQVWSCHIKSFLGGGRGPSSQILSQDGGPPPCSERRRGGEKPGKEEPGGKEGGGHNSFRTVVFIEHFWFFSLGSYFDWQKL